MTTSDPLSASELSQLFPGDSEMAHRMRSFDWSQSPLGPPDTWPQNLKAAVTLCLGSRFPIVIWWDREEAIQFYNDAYISFLGPTKHPAFMGRSGRECWREIWESMGPLWDKVFGSGEATWSEDFLYVINRRLPQEEGYFTFSYSPIRGAAGTVEGIFCACYETTGKVVGARRLETLRRLGEQAMEAYSVADACERAAAVLRENPHDVPFARIYRLDSSCKLPADAIAPEALRSVLQTRRPVTISGLDLPGGPWPERATQAVVLPLLSSTSDNVAGLIVLGVSPRRPLDAEYRTFFDLIAGHVSTAMANASAREEERKRVEALAEIDRAKTAFFSNVSHEFRTPLTLMLGPLEDLLSKAEEDLPSEDRDQISLVHMNSLRLLKLVNTLLDFSRIEAGRIQVVYEPTDLAAFTAELSSVFRSAVEKAGLSLNIDCPSLPEPIYVDREMWEKVVLNLLSNAFKFTFEGEISVLLRWCGDRIEMDVKDTGTGIAPEELPHLFERFHRIKGARSRSYEGTGIGLALVSELVRLHGGSIKVDSTLGEGTIFTVTIPAGCAHLPADRIGATRTLASTSTGAAPYAQEALRLLPEDISSDSDLTRSYPAYVPADRTRARVLLADDNADMRGYIHRLLSSHYEVEAVADGRQALDASLRNPPDLILTDIMMPILDGFGLLRALRSDPRTQSIPVIFLSARAGEESKAEGMEVGADDYLVKPFSARELMARVAAHLQMARIRQEAAMKERELRKELEKELDERKQAEEALRESEARFLSVLDSSQDIIYRLNLQSNRYEYLSPSCKVLFGFSPAEMMAMDTQEIFERTHPDDLSGAKAALANILVAGYGRLEFRWLTRSGEYRWISTSLTITRDSDGRPLYRDGVARDITECKKAEEALQDSEKKYRSLFENMLDGFAYCKMLYDDQGGPIDFVYLDVNSAFERLTGLKDVIGKRVTEALPGILEAHPELFNTYNRVASTGNPEKFEIEFKLLGIWLSISVYSTEKGYFVAVFDNITERKRAEEKLRESEERFRAVQDNSLDRFTILKPFYDDQGEIIDFTYIYQNAQAARTAGRRPEELIGLRMSEIFPTFPQSRFFAMYKLAVETGQVTEFEDRYQADGVDDWFRATVTPIPDCIAVATQIITERKKAEEALRESQEQYRGVVENTTAIILRMDPRGIITFANRRALEFFGFTAHELIGKHAIGTIVPSQETTGRDLAAMVDEIALNPDRFHSNANENICKDGRRVWMEWTNSGIYDGDGKLKEFLSVGIDATERKRAEEALRQSEARYRMLHESLRDPFVQVSMDGQIIEFNDLYCQMMGYSSEELRTLTYQDLTPERWHASEETIVREQIIGRGYSDVYQKEYRRKDGTVIPVELRTILSRDEEGRPNSMWGIVRDITERKQAEEALQRLNTELEHRVQERTTKLVEAGKKVQAERQRFLDMLDTLPVIIDIIRPDYQIEWANRAYREALGNNQGRLCFESQFGRDKPCEECQAFIPLDTGQPHHWEWTLPNGRTFDIYNFPFADAEGSPVILEMDIDITERKKTEAQLIKAKEAAEAATKAKAEFLANMSHEIRTPMNSIIGFTELLLDDADDPLSLVQKENLETVRANGDALLTIINDILDFSKMESDKIVLEEYQFLLRALVEESLDLVAIKSAEKGINLAYTIDKDVPDTIIGDLARLRQVIGNLLSNAVKFTNKGEVTLSVSVNEADEIHFAVQDTGIGIPSDSMKLLFQPFNQMEPSTTRLYGGTGLGLAISKRLVELMGGKIWAESEEGKGSIFHFTIKAPSESGPQPVEVSPLLIGKRVLIIEDNRTNRRILGKQVYDWGMIPMATSSGQEALKYIRRGDDFDIAILDMDLQTMDSLELEEEIRKYNKTLPLVLMTSLGKRIPPNHAYLTKPIKPSQMHRVLTEILPKAVIMPTEPDKRPVEASNQPIQCKPLKILLAEDNISSQKVAQQMLKKLGYRADVVASGIEVLQSLERQHYDVVLMDLKMPEMDGLEATRIIRQRWPHDGPKIIAITAYALEGDREKCLEAGMNDYIAKPVQKEDLARALKDINRL